MDPVFKDVSSRWRSTRFTGILTRLGETQLESVDPMLSVDDRFPLAIASTMLSDLNSFVEDANRVPISDNRHGSASQFGRNRVAILRTYGIENHGWPSFDVLDAVCGSLVGKGSFGRSLNLPNRS